MQWLQSFVIESVPWLKSSVSTFVANLQSFGDAPKHVKESTNVVSFLWNFFIMGMILYFIISTIEGLALSHMKQRNKKIE